MGYVYKQYSVGADATLTTTTNSSTVKASNVESASIYISVDGSVSGTSPTLSAQLQTKDANDNWVDVGTATTNLTAAGSESTLNITGPFGTEFRVKQTVGGTSPSFGGTDVAVHFKIATDA